MIPVTARASANIALAKYWGKLDDALNLPAVPSVSVTLAGLDTQTSVVVDERLAADRFALDGVPATELETQRVRALLDRVRARTGDRRFANVESRNNFPTAAGLASSASGFAALAVAATRAYGLTLEGAELSALARRSSASAARSLFGGFVKLDAGDAGDDSLAARPIFPAEHWDLRVVVAVVSRRRKPVGSTRGMGHSRETSIYYDAWCREAPQIAARVEGALRAKDLVALGAAVEASAFAMHACAMAASPATIYFEDGTLAAIDAVRRLRDEEGILAFATMDAGPQVKVVTRAGDVPTVRARLEALPSVDHVLVAEPGDAAKVVAQ